jgi:hypothetical protein
MPSFFFPPPKFTYRRLSVPCLALAALLAASQVAAEPLSRQVNEGAQREVSLTVYSNNFAVVREVRETKLPKGIVELEYRDVARDIDPTSVTVKARGASSEQFNLLEQNYRYDLLNRQTLLARFVNKKLKYARSVLQDGQYETVYREGNLLSVGPEIVDFGDEIEVEPLGTITLSYIPEELKSQPTLLWLIDNRKAGSTLLETSYITGNIRWQADYIMVLDQEKPVFDLSAWVSLENRSGTQFRNASLKLVAGQVNRVSDRRPEMERPMAAMRMDAQMPKQETLFEHHLYSLPRKTTLANNETKQLQLIAATDLKFDKVYILASQVPNYQTAEMRKSSFDVHLRFINQVNNGLGEPLPAGKARVYQRDSDGQLQLVGEDQMAHLPKGEMADLNVGQAFDLVAERSQLEFRRLGERVIEMTNEIVIRNQKTEGVSVTLNEKLFGDWQITSESHKGLKSDAATQTYEIALQAGGETTVRYTARLNY